MPSAMEVTARLDRLRRVLTGLHHRPDAFLVTSLTNIRYLTGFTGSAGMLFLFSDEAVLLTDGRYGTQAAEQLVAAGVDARVEVAPAADQAARAQRIAGDGGVARLGLEAAHISWARQQSFATNWFPDVELISTVDLVEGLRRVKDAGELARLAEAARIADLALDHLRPQLGSGLSEEAFGRALDFEMRQLGASGPSFETIIASGPNAAKPHHRPGSARHRHR